MGGPPFAFITPYQNDRAGACRAGEAAQNGRLGRLWGRKFLDIVR